MADLPFNQCRGRPGALKPQTTPNDLQFAEMSSLLTVVVGLCALSITRIKLQKSVAKEFDFTGKKELSRKPLQLCALGRASFTYVLVSLRTPSDADDGELN